MAETTKNGAPRKPKGPELNWNADRRYALAAAIASGVTSTSELAAVLANNEAFAGVQPGVITAGKIRLQLKKLRDAGVPVPELGRGGRDSIDVTGLSALFGGAAPAEAASGE